MLDSRNNDAIYKHPQYGTDNYASPPQFQWFGRIHPNHDKSQLLLPTGDYASAFAVFDQATERVTPYVPPVNDRSGFIRPNRKDGRVYLGGYYQLIVDPSNGYVSAQSRLDDRNDGSGDFSYREDEPETAYYCDNEYLRVVDYRSAAIKASYTVDYGMRGTTATSDGKYLILYRREPDYKEGTTDFYSTVFQFSAGQL
jgi:hypothetical protein